MEYKECHTKRIHMTKQTDSCSCGQQFHSPNRTTRTTLFVVYERFWTGGQCHVWSIQLAMWSVKCQPCRMNEWTILFIRIDISDSRHSSQTMCRRTIVWMCDRVSSQNDDIGSIIIVVHDSSLSENSPIPTTRCVVSCVLQSFLSLYLLLSIRQVVLCCRFLPMVNHGQQCA